MDNDFLTLIRPEVRAKFEDFMHEHGALLAPVFTQGNTDPEMSLQEFAFECFLETENI